MTYVLDTNVCISALRGEPDVLAALGRRVPAELAVTSVTLAELWFGARKTRNPKRMRQLQDAFLAPYAVLDFDRDAAARYAEIRHGLERRGQPIGERDQMIAAIALAHARTVVTRNRREFDRVAGLNVIGPDALPE